MNKNNLILAGFLVLLAFVARVAPHVSNFSPLIAIALFSGAVFSGNKWFYLIPVVGLVASDFILGFHNLSPVIYFVLGLIALVGISSKGFKAFNLSSNMSLLMKTTLAAVFFFITTNLAVFFLTSMYPKNWAGLVECYSLALPFFRSTLVSSLFYSAVLFNGYAYLVSKKPVRVTS